MNTPLDYLRPIWTVRATARVVSADGQEVTTERNQSYQPVYLWEARRSARHCNCYYQSPTGLSYTKYDVVRWDYFSERESGRNG